MVVVGSGLAGFGVLREPRRLLPPPRTSEGEWRRLAEDERGGRHGFVDARGVLRGYVLTHSRCEERTAMDALVGTRL